ncbi:hypothetical protein Dcar01_02364 [Deinococcus carri]|uniref:Uncharacterized protein n=1 Tax=Deinococcus carri TaxID=1211323 RepID=A0ABP9WAX7_9DEIO
MNASAARGQQAQREADRLAAQRRRLLDEEQQAAATNRHRRSPRKITSKQLLTLTAGEQVFYVPRNVEHPYAGSRARVLRAPRKDVKIPTVRLQFLDGTQKTVPLKHVSRAPATAAPPAFLIDARSRPSWKRLMNQLLEANAQEAGGAAGVAALRQAADQRARQLAALVVPRGSAQAVKTDAARVLLDAAQAEAVALAARQPGRNGRAVMLEAPLPDERLQVQTEELNQRSRLLINNIARCIHKRYFLSDAEARETAQISSTVRRMIDLAEREYGTNSRPDNSGQGKGNATAGVLQDSLLAMYSAALEACNLRAQGDTVGAEVMEREVQTYRAEYELANAELERHRKKFHTGRYFHGEILSVREERRQRDDQGMMQFYVRLVVVYDRDCHTPVVVNGREIEARTLVEVGEAGWAALGRWIQDLADREHGRKQGRRQDDDWHLIYRDNDGHLRLRENVSDGLLRAFDAIRRAMVLNDVDPAEIPSTHPEAGLHLPQTKNTPENREQRKKALGDTMQSIMARALEQGGLTNPRQN